MVGTAKEKKMNFTKEQIAEYKAKHGQIFLIEIEDKSCILHAPTRRDVSYASVVKDPMKMNEVMLNQLWVAGDEEIKTQDDLFMAAVNKLDVVLQVKEASVKKL